MTSRLGQCHNGPRPKPTKAARVKEAPPAEKPQLHKVAEASVGDTVWINYAGNWLEGTISDGPLMMVNAGEDEWGKPIIAKMHIGAKRLKLTNPSLGQRRLMER